MSAPGGIELTRQIQRRCAEQGFALFGITGARDSEHIDHVHAWLANGRHGSMDYLRDDMDVRLRVERLWPGARSIIVVADQYATRGDDEPAPSPRTGRIARYARGGDYHHSMRQRLHAVRDWLITSQPPHRFRAFCDNSPVLEREHAARAGIGYVGKHTLIINPQRGSYLLLGGIISTLELSVPPEQHPPTDRCGTCTRCIDACPTGAITPHSVDASRCISYLTIERKGLIPEPLHGPLGDWLFGCDVCQEVCPHNSPRAPGADVGEAHRDYAPRRSGLDLLELLDWTPQDRAVAMRHSAMRRARLEMLKRNALVLAGNVLRQHDDAALRARVMALRTDPAESELVRAAADQVCRRLGL